MGKHLGLKIKQLRSDYSLKTGEKFTQVDLSKMLGISRSYLGDIESGRTNPSIELLTKLAKVFDIDVNSLISSEENLKLNIDSLKKTTDIPDAKEKTYKEKEIDTIAAHLEEKNLTPKKVKLLKDYIDALFDDEEW